MENWIPDMHKLITALKNSNLKLTENLWNGKDWVRLNDYFVCQDRLIRVHQMKIKILKGPSSETNSFKDLIQEIEKLPQQSANELLEFLLNLLIAENMFQSNLDKLELLLNTNKGGYHFFQQNDLINKIVSNEKNENEEKLKELLKTDYDWDYFPIIDQSLKAGGTVKEEESFITEYKSFSTTGQDSQYIKRVKNSIETMENSEGGSLYFGINDEYKALGCQKHSLLGTLNNAKIPTNNLCSLSIQNSQLTIEYLKITKLAENKSNYFRGDACTVKLSKRFTIGFSDSRFLPKQCTRSYIKNSNPRMPEKKDLQNEHPTLDSLNQTQIYTRSCFKLDEVVTLQDMEFFSRFGSLLQWEHEIESALNEIKNLKEEVFIVYFGIIKESTPKKGKVKGTLLTRKDRDTFKALVYPRCLEKPFNIGCSVYNQILNLEITFIPITDENKLIVPGRFIIRVVGTVNLKAVLPKIQFRIPECTILDIMQ